MSYYGAGDYYGAGGLGSFLGGIAKAGIGLITGGPQGAVSSVVRSFTGGGGRPPTINVPFGGAPGAGIGRIGTPAHMTAMSNQGAYFTKDGRPRRIRKDGKPWKRPTMNPGNTKALVRADRRIDRFVGIAKKALRHTNYTVVTKGSRRGSKRSTGNVIVETGPGGVRA